MDLWGTSVKRWGCGGCNSHEMCIKLTRCVELGCGGGWARFADRLSTELCTGVDYCSDVQVEGWSKETAPAVLGHREDTPGR